MLTLKRSIRAWVVVAFVFLSTMQLKAQASPFLVCDPYPAGTAVTSFTLFWDGATTGVVVPVLTDATGTYFHVDLSTVTNGSHTVKARARNTWAESGDSLPFVFVKAAPTSPLNIRISTN